MKLLFTPLFFISLFACNEKKHPGPTFSESRTITVSAAAPKTDIASYSDFLFTDGEREYIVFANQSTKQLDFINLKNNHTEFSISLAAVDSVFDFSFNKLKFFVQSKDSVFILPDESQSVFLINGTGKVISNRNLRMKQNDMTFVLSGFPNNPMQFFNGRLYLRCVPKIATFHEKKTYFSISPEIVLKSDTAAPVGHAGGWPETYTTVNYYDDYPLLCLTKNEGRTQLVYSFASQPDLYVYEGEKLVSRHPAASDSVHEPTPFPDDSIGNIAFTMRYLVTVPRYGKVLYDPYRKIYYRVAYHASGYYSDDGTTTRRPFDRPWSIIVLDEHFTKLGEWNFDPSVYAFSPLYVSREGLLVPHRETDNSDTYHWQFGVFEFHP